MADSPHRARIKTEVEIDLTQKSDQHLLEDVHDESVNAPKENAALARTLARFASLLVILSRRTEESSQRLEKYTATLVSLTWALAIIAGVTVIAVGVQIYLIFYPPK